MINNFDKSLVLVLKSEGGFTADSRDPGNSGGKCTNLGVTQKAWEEYVGHPVSRTVMECLTPAAVAPLYRQRYWNLCHCDYLPSGLDYMTFDFAVNAGPGRAIRTLQSAVGATPDGAIGPKTMAMVGSAKDALEQFSAVKRAFYQSLPTFPAFGKGWLKRVDDVLNNAKSMRDTVAVAESGHG